MLRFLILASACLMTATALAQPEDQGFHPHPMCVPVAAKGEGAARPCPIPPPPRPGMAPLEEGSPCKCGTVPGKVQNGPRPS